MPEISLPAHGWMPRDYQMELWKALEGGCLRSACAWHRRAGKDDVFLHWAAVCAMQRVGPYWHMLPMASQARKAVWNAVNPRTGRRRIDDAFPLEIREKTLENEMFIRFKNGATWQVVGSDNFNALVGSPPVGISFSEYALADPQAWAMLRPILVENGGWAAFISTTRGRNHFHKLVEYAKNDPDWFGQTLTVEDTGVISLDAIARERRELTAERGEDEADAIIAQEYYCDASASIPGAYYGKLMSRVVSEGRRGSFPWIPGLPVGTSWDLGHGDSTVVWFYQQPPGGKVRLIDVLEGSGVGIDWYARKLADRPYVYADHIWPHDGGHGNIRDVEGETLLSTAESLGIRPIRVMANDMSIAHGIQGARGMLPLCEFNTDPIPFTFPEPETKEQAKARAERAFDAMNQYRREWDTKLLRYSDSPYHDWTSHTADSFRYLARGRKPFPGNEPPKPLKINRRHVT
jgi:hypothetical protein